MQGLEFSVLIANLRNLRLTLQMSTFGHVYSQMSSDVLSVSASWDNRKVKFSMSIHVPQYWHVVESEINTEPTAVIWLARVLFLLINMYWNKPSLSRDLWTVNMSWWRVCQTAFGLVLVFFDQFHPSINLTLSPI